MADRLKTFQVSGDRGSCTAQFSLTQHPDIVYKTSPADVGETLFLACVNSLLVAYASNLNINVIANTDRVVRGVEFPARPRGFDEGE